MSDNRVLGGRGRGQQCDANSPGPGVLPEGRGEEDWAGQFIGRVAGRLSTPAHPHHRSFFSFCHGRRLVNIARRGGGRPPARLYHPVPAVQCRLVQVLAQLRPFLAGAGGGDLALQSVDAGIVKVRLTGPAKSIIGRPPPGLSGSWGIPIVDVDAISARKPTHTHTHSHTLAHQHQTAHTRTSTSTHPHPHPHLHIPTHPQTHS